MILSRRAAGLRRGCLWEWCRLGVEEGRKRHGVVRVLARVELLRLRATWSSWEGYCLSQRFRALQKSRVSSRRVLLWRERLGGCVAQWGQAARRSVRLSIRV